MSWGTFQGHVYPVSDCLDLRLRKLDLDWCQCSSGWSKTWKPPGRCIGGQDNYYLPSQPSTHRPDCYHRTPINVTTVEIAGIETGVRKHWEI